MKSTQMFLCSLASGGGPPTNAPSLEVEHSSLPTYLTSVGDSLRALVTVDDGDGVVTTGVSIYQDGVLLGAATNDGGGAWHYDFVAPVFGTYAYTARRVTATGDIDSSSWPMTSTRTPAQIWGTTRLRHFRFAQAADITHTGGLVDQWNDISGNATVTNGTALTTARPTWLPSGDVGNDNSLPGLGYVHYDGTTDGLDIAALNLPTPGAAQKNFGWLVVRNWAWVNLDRIVASIGAAARQIIYQSPTKPGISQLNGAASAQNTVNGVPADPSPDWGLLMFEFTGSTNDFVKYCNYLSTGGNAGTSAGTTGRREGRDASNFAAIDVQQAGYVLDSTSVTAQEMQHLIDRCNYLYPEGVAAPQAVWIQEGDSITAIPNGQGVTTYAAASVTETKPKLVRRYNIASPGESSANALAQFNAQALVKFNTGTSPTVLNIYSLLIGVNDFPLFAIDFNATFNNIVSIINLVHAQGGKFIGSNLIDQWSFTGANRTNFDALRAKLVTDLAPLCDAFVNPAGVIPGTGSDGIYWVDATHPTNLGQTYIAPLFKAAVAGLIP